MYDIRKLIDPLVFAMKLRDSMESGNPSHVQNYLLDSLKNSVNQPRNQNESSPTTINPQMQKSMQDTLSQSLSQIQGMPGFGNSSYLQNYIQSVMNSSLNQAFGQPINQLQEQPTRNNITKQSTEETKENAQVFETHDYVFVRMTVPKQVDERFIDTQVGLNKVLIKWGPNQKNGIIQLPTDVRNDGAVASVRNHILEIKIPKEFTPNYKKVQIQREE